MMKAVHVIQDMLHDNLNPSTTTFGILTPDQEVALRHAVDFMNAAYMVKHHEKSLAVAQAKLDSMTE